MIQVVFSKVFVSGYLNGIRVKCILPMATKKLANEYIEYCKKHATNPVSSIVGSGSTYLIDNAFIEKIESDL